MPNDGTTNLNDALISAVEGNEFNTAVELLAKGAKPLSIKDKLSCLHFAIKNHNAELFRLLLNKQAPFVRVVYNGREMTVMEYATALEAWNCVIQLAQYYKVDSNDLGKYKAVLPLVVHRHQHEAVQALVKALVPVNKKEFQSCAESKKIALSANDVIMLFLLENKRLPDFVTKPEFICDNSSPKISSGRRGSTCSFFIDEEARSEIPPLPTQMLLGQSKINESP